MIADPVLAAVADGPTAAFLQSTTEVQAYSEFMASVAMTGIASVDAVLATAKADAAQWYDSIFPEYLDMPSTISSYGPTIDAGLSLLTQLAGQLQASPSDAIRQAVDEQAASLQTTVNSIQRQTDALANGLQSFSGNLHNDSTALNGAAGTAQNSVAALQQQLASLYGQLQHLKGATCPSTSDITACEQTIAVTQQQLTAAQSALQIVTSAGDGALTAGSGLSYLERLLVGRRGGRAELRRSARGPDQRSGFRAPGRPSEHPDPVEHPEGAVPGSVGTTEHDLANPTAGRSDAHRAPGRRAADPAATRRLRQRGGRDQQLRVRDHQSGPPGPAVPATNYGTFATQFTPAKQHALNWTDNIFVSMLQLPVTIKQQAADLFNLESTMIEAYLNILIATPGNATAKNDLQSALNALQQVIAQQVTTVESIEAGLTQFASDIYTDAQTLTGIAQAATADSGSDQALITQINADIATLNQEIATAQLLLTVSEIGIGLSIFVGLVGAVVCFIPGAQGLGIGIVIAAVGGLAGSIAGTVIENKEIAAMQAQIDSDQSQISGLGQDIILLNGVSSQFNSLYDSNLAAQAALVTIKTQWTDLDRAIDEVKQDLADVARDTTSAQYQQALTDFQAAETNWASVVAFADALAGIDYQWQDPTGAWHSFTQSPPGTDSAQVNQIPSTITGP